MNMYRLNHEQLLKGVNMNFRRYLLREIRWDEPLIGLFGAGGVGKTTLLLQHIKAVYGDSAQALYLPLDNLWFKQPQMLFETAAKFYADGGRHLFLDHVHHYADWAEAIDRLLAAHPEMQIVFAAPLLLEGDDERLPRGRHADCYRLHTLSFREYLSYEGALTLKPTPLDELLANHAEITQQVMGEVHLAPIFRNYLKHGCYPFYWEDPDAFPFRLQEMMLRSVGTDLTSVHPMEPATLSKAYQILLHLAKEAPAYPVVQQLMRDCDLSRYHVEALLEKIWSIGLFRLMQTIGGDGLPTRPFRSFPANSNLSASFFREMEGAFIGETFFVDQMSNCGSVEMLPDGSYRVNEKYIFRVEGLQVAYEPIEEPPAEPEQEDAACTATTDVAPPRLAPGKLPLWALGLCY